MYSSRALINVWNADTKERTKRQELEECTIIDLVEYEKIQKIKNSADENDINKKKKDYTRDQQLQV